MTGFRLGCGKQQSGARDKLSPPSKPTALIDGVTAPSSFGIKNYLHQFYQSPTVEDIEHSAWYLLPPPPSTRRGLFICRVCTLIGLLLLVGGACCIVVGYTWPHEGVQDSIYRVAIFQDEEGNFYVPREKLREILQDPLRKWKTSGFCIFSAGAILLAFSLLVPTLAQCIGSRHLASFASEDNSPNEPPVRIFAGHPGLSGAPIPVAEEVSKVQPGETTRPSDDLLSH